MPKAPPSPTYIRQWREHRGLSLERLADRLGTTKASLSRIERGLQPYSQPMLEALAAALMCEPADLLMRDPTDPEGIWSIWDSLEPPAREQVTEIAKTFRKAS